MSEKELLDKLLTYFYINEEGEVSWSWQEGYCPFTPRFNNELVKYFKENEIESE